MAISFVRIDDRMIHGQTVTRWSKEYPCTGLIAVNDAAASNKVLKEAYKSASDKKTFVWTKDHFKDVQEKVLKSADQYFLITKNPLDMKYILVDLGFVPGDVKTVIVGPCNDRPGATKLGNNQSITQEEAEALEAIYQKGYTVKFSLIPDITIGTWEDFRGKFGFYQIIEKRGKKIMVISWLQAALLGLFACLASMPGMGGTSFGNYTLGRPLVGGLVCGLILGDLKLGILCGVAMQVVYIALVTPGGTVSADVRAISYIGIPLAMVAVKSQGLAASSPAAAGLATSMGTLVGTVGTVLFYGTATLNLAWQSYGWKAVEKGDFHKLYLVDWVLPWVSHILFSFIPTLIMCKLGATAVTAMKDALPMDGLAMKTLFTVGALLPCVGIAILVKQIVEKPTDFIPFFVGFTLAASLGLNLVSAAVVSLIFAVITYELQIIKTRPVAQVAIDDDEEEEDI